MTTSVLARRFVNTPTVMELYESEAGGDQLPVAEKVEDKLSDEYDQVDGSEGYYRYTLQHLPRAHADLDGVVGNEGLIQWVKDTVGTLIQAVKNFFKWLFSFFTSKSKIAETKMKKLEAALDKNGVKGGYHAYPPVYINLWASKAKVPDHLDWMAKSLDTLEAAIVKGQEYVKAIEWFSNDTKQTVLAHGQLSKAWEHYQDGEKQFHDKLEKIFGKENSLFIGGTHVTVMAGGKVQIDPDPELLEADKEGKWTTNDTTVRTLFKKLDRCNTAFDKLLTDITKLESEFIKTLEKTVTAANEMEQLDLLNADKVVSGVKKQVSQAMASIKVLETLFLKVISAGITVVTATVNQG
jgi:hypothetical protein